MAMDTGWAAIADFHALVTGEAAHADIGSLASAIGSTVWVACLSGHANARLILDGTSHGSTLAAVAGGGGAVNKLLLREAHQLSRGEELPSSLSAASGGKWPARSALGLILDGVDGTGSDPVDLSWQLRTIVQVLTEV